MLKLRIFTLCSICIVTCLKQVQAYCWEPGKNPGFTGPPHVEQVNLTHVLVSWKGIVTQRNCADQFLVKFWQTNSPQDYVITDLLDTSVDSIVVKVVPKIDYTFQAVAREDKGTIIGVDWNKSPVTNFKTSSKFNEVISPPAKPKPSKNVQTIAKVDQSVTPTLVLESHPEEKKASFSIEVLAIVVVGGIGVLLAFVGVVFTLFCKNKVKDEDEESCSDEENKYENEILTTSDLR